MALDACGLGDRGGRRDGGQRWRLSDAGEGVVVVVVVVTPNFFTVGGEGAQEGDEEGKAEK